MQRGRALPTSIAWLALLATAPAIAQDASGAPAADGAPHAGQPAPTTDSSGDRLEEIIVEGERADTTLKESAHSISVITKEQLRLGTYRDMDDLYTQMANVAVTPGTDELVVRGIAANGITNGDFHGGFHGAVPNIVNFVDGFFTPSPRQSLWDARQVELARGPEDYASGGAQEGASAVVSNPIGAAANGDVTAAWSPEPNERSLGAAYGAPVGENFGYRVSGYLRTRDGFMKNTFRDGSDWNSYDEWDGRLILEWRPFGDDGTVATFRFEHLKTSEKGGNYIVTADPNVDPFDDKTAVNTPERREDETISANALLVHRIDEHWELEYRAHWSEQHHRETQDGDGTAVDDSSAQNHLDQAFIADQIRLFYENGPWQAYLRHYDLHDHVDNGWSSNYFHFDLDGPGPFPSSTFDLRFAYPTPNWWFIGTQAGATRELGKLTLSASLLYSGNTANKQRGLTTTRFGSTGDPDADATYDYIYANFFPQVRIIRDGTEFDWLPSAVADYALTDRVNVGAKYERSARPSDIWFNAARGTINPYRAEHSDSYDLYLRASSFADRLSLRANAFYTRIVDQQLWAGFSDAFLDGQFVNVPRAHNDGLEVEAQWHQGDWQVWTSSGLLETRFDRFVVPEGDNSGNEFPDAPNWTLAFGLLYARPRGLFASADASLRPHAEGDFRNVPGVREERQRLVNCRVGWAFAHADASIYARNLFDEHYLTYRDSAISEGPGAIPTYLVGAPREVGMVVSIHL